MGAGLVGLTTAWRLQRMLGAEEAELAVVNPENFMVYQSLLPEVASGMLEPTDVVAPLRGMLGGAEVMVGRLNQLDTDRRVATVRLLGDGPRELPYDHAVLALGSETRMLPVPGLAENAVGFTTVPEALYLRDHVLSRLEAAANSDDAGARRRALTFVFVGGGYSGVEALGELESMATAAAALYPKVPVEEQRWVLVEATERILPMVDERLADAAADALHRRGVDVRLKTVLESAEDGVLQLSDGDELEADTLVWAAGITPNPLVAELGLPVGDNGAVQVDEFLRVAGSEGVWAAGDCAAVPDLERGGLCPPSAQYALREAHRLADNLVAAIRGERLLEFRYRPRGELLTIGRRDGIGELYGRHLRGFTPWYLRRLYHIARVPGVQRKVQVWLNWLVRMAGKPDVVSLGSIRQPGAPLETASQQQRKAR